jgi:quinol monooxygenase YgiN
MTVIDAERPVVTMINTFTVEPANQERLVTLIIEATESVMRKVPGFVSANIHASLDGTRVVNYAQWRSQADFEAMLRNPEVHPHFGEIRAIAAPERHLYRVSFVEDGASDA